VSTQLLEQHHGDSSSLAANVDDLQQEILSAFRGEVERVSGTGGTSLSAAKGRAQPPYFFSSFCVSSGPNPGATLASGGGGRFFFVRAAVRTFFSSSVVPR
jgi:hypothetical protein